MPYKRARIYLDTNRDVMEFVKSLNSDGSIDRYILEDVNGRDRVNARSYLGALYASTEWSGEIYLVNETNDGNFPLCVDFFRA